MKTKNTIIYISDCIPWPGFGSATIAYRHLKRLSDEGHQIIALLPAVEVGIYSTYFEKSWEIITIPSRKWWFLPYRQGSEFLVWFRAYTLLIDNWSIFKKHKNARLVSYFSGFIYPLFAALVCKFHKIPLAFFLHDDQLIEEKDASKMQLMSNKIYKYILSNSNLLWAVSTYIYQKYKPYNANIIELYPIPEGKLMPLKLFEAKPIHLVFAGQIHDGYIPIIKMIGSILEEIGGKLTLICTYNFSDNVLPAVHLQKPFKYKDELFSFLHSNATALVICYPLLTHNNLWLKNSFPSKLVDFAFTTLPLVIIADAPFFIVEWSKKMKLDIVDRIDENQIKTFLLKLKIKSEWEKMRDKSIDLATDEFDADKIHNTFEKSLFALK